MGIAWGWFGDGLGIVWGWFGDGLGIIWGWFGEGWRWDGDGKWMGC